MVVIRIVSHTLDCLESDHALQGGLNMQQAVKLPIGKAIYMHIGIHNNYVHISLSIIIIQVHPLYGPCKYKRGFRVQTYNNGFC